MKYELENTVFSTTSLTAAIGYVLISLKTKGRPIFYEYLLSKLMTLRKTSLEGAFSGYGINLLLETVAEKPIESSFLKIMEVIS